MPFRSMVKPYHNRGKAETILELLYGSEGLRFPQTSPPYSQVVEVPFDNVVVAHQSNQLHPSM